MVPALETKGTANMIVSKKIARVKEVDLKKVRKSLGRNAKTIDK